jgi:hypothetical protein
MLPAFKPAWNARLGAESLYAAYVKEGVQVEAFEGAQFRRVDHIKLLTSEGKLDSSLRWRQAIVA